MKTRNNNERDKFYSDWAIDDNYPDNEEFEEIESGSSYKYGDWWEDANEHTQKQDKRNITSKSTLNKPKGRK